MTRDGFAARRCGSTGHRFHIVGEPIVAVLRVEARHGRDVVGKVGRKLVTDELMFTPLLERNVEVANGPMQCLGILSGNDFIMLNAITDDPAPRAAIAQATAFLKEACGHPEDTGR